MKRVLISLTGVLGAAMMPAQAADSKTYDFTDFTGVRVAAGYDAEIEVGSGYSITATTETGDLDWLDISVRGDTLVITRKKKISWNWSGPRTLVRVTMPALESLDVSSGADAEATGVDSERFSVDVSSGADADVSG